MGVIDRRAAPVSQEQYEPVCQRTKTLCGDRRFSDSGVGRKPGQGRRPELVCARGDIKTAEQCSESS